MGMKYRDPETGQFKDLKVKTSDTLPIGTQVAYGGAIPPTGWLICDGSAVSRTTYAELFKVIGTSYGAGDGSTTFNLPNKKGRVSAGLDSTNSKFNAIGKHLGEETHTLTLAELPRKINIAYGSSSSTSDTGAIDANSIYTLATVKGSVTLTSGGNGQSHNNIQPTEVDNWIIKAFQSIGVVGKVVNTKTTSDTDTYSCNYINGIIESGSNENGSYIKFADGTLICIGDTMNVLDSEIAEAQFLVTYPIAFVNYPSVTISNVYSYYRDLILSVAAPTPSNFRVNWYKQSGTTENNSNIRVYWTAIGKWK